MRRIFSKGEGELTAAVILPVQPQFFTKPNRLQISVFFLKVARQPSALISGEFHADFVDFCGKNRSLEPLPRVPLLLAGADSNESIALRLQGNPYSPLLFQGIVHGYSPVSRNRFGTGILLMYYTVRLNGFVRLPVYGIQVGYQC